MKSKGIAWCTATFYKNPTEGLDSVRFAETCKTVQNAVNLGTPIYVVDESPESNGVSARLSELGATVLTPDQPGMGPCRAQAVETAMKAGCCPFWTEPEKATLITDRNVPLMHDLLDASGRGTGVVVPHRTSVSMDSYPLFQAYSEEQGNRELCLLTNFWVDWYIGPRLMNLQCAEYFIQHHRRTPDPKWAALMTFLVEVEQSSWWHVTPVVAPDYRYSAAQKAAETDNEEMLEHRRKQRDTIHLAVMAECARLDRKSLEGYAAT